MGRLSKRELAAHAAACRLIDSGRPLSSDEIDQCYQDWHEGATSNQTAASAFFTPIDMAADMRFDMPGRGSFVDLCAGTGRLAYYAGAQHCWPESRPSYSRIVCVERNPEYVAIGRRLFPAAEWICGDALDPAVWRQIGQVDFAIANPPFGRTTKSDYAAPRYRGAEFELAALDVMAHLAPEGWAIVPASTAPFDGTGRGRVVDTSKADRWREATGLGLHRFANVDPQHYRDQWRGTCPAVELVEFSATEYGETPKPVRSAALGLPQAAPAPILPPLPAMAASAPQPAQLALF